MSTHLANTPPQLSDGDRRKLAGILARLASNHDGEKLAAASLASRFVSNRGLSWPDLLLPVEPVASAPKPPPEPARSEPIEPWRRDAQRLLVERGHQLTKAEREFCQRLVDWRGRVSPKQLAWLNKLARRELSEAAA